MLESTQGTAHTPVSQGQAVQVFLSAATLGLTSPGTSGLIPSCGYTKLAVGATSSSTGQITVQRYLDQAGTIPQGPALTQALAAATAGVLNVTDGLPFQAFTIAIAGGTLSNVGALLQSQ